MQAKNFIPSLVTAAALAWAAGSAQAAIINITSHNGVLVGDVSMGVLGNNSPENSYDWLAGEGAFEILGGIVENYNTITGSALPAPVYTGFLDGGKVNPFDLTGYTYAVLHYGKGSGGLGQGGGIVAYYLNGLTGNYSFPAQGLGPNGLGGLSSVRLFKSVPTPDETPRIPVPDGGSMIALLGLSLAGLGVFRRKIAA